MAERASDASGRPWSLVDLAWELIGVQVAFVLGAVAAERAGWQLVGFVAVDTPCRCLCALHWKTAPGVCAGAAEPWLTVTRFSEATGPRLITICRACFDAVGGR